MNVRAGGRLTRRNANVAAASAKKTSAFVPATDGGDAESAEPADRHHCSEPVVAIHEVEEIGGPDDGERRRGHGENMLRRNSFRRSRPMARRRRSRARRARAIGEADRTGRTPHQSSAKDTAVTTAHGSKPRGRRPARSARTGARPAESPPKWRYRRPATRAGRAAIGRRDSPAANGAPLRKRSAERRRESNAARSGADPRRIRRMRSCSRAIPASARIRAANLTRNSGTRPRRIRKPLKIDAGGSAPPPTREERQVSVG